MNKAYKIFWNTSRQVWMVVGELSKGKTKSSTAKPASKLTKHVASVLLGLGLGLSSISSMALDTTWTGLSNQDWLTSSNWSPDILPSATRSTYINEGAVSLTSNGSAEVFRLYIGITDIATLSISDGATLATSWTGGSAFIANEASGSGSSVTVDGVGSSWNNTGDFYIGWAGDANASITNGGSVTSRDTYIAGLAGTSASLTVDGEGSSWDATGPIYIGLEGDASLNISNGGSISSVAHSYIGYETGSNGSVTVDGAGSIWDNRGSTGSAQINVGHSGTGTLNITNGGTVFSDYVSLGFRSGSSGTVTVDGLGSNLTITEQIFVGEDSASNLIIKNGGKVSHESGGGFIGMYAGSSSVTVDGSASIWDVKNFVRVGQWGDASLTIKNGGTVTVSPDPNPSFMYIAQYSGSTGILNIGSKLGDSAVAAGILNVDSLLFGAGDGAIVFNHTETAYDFSPTSISGSGAIGLYSGSTRFVGDLSTFDGTMTIDGGTLAINAGETLSLGGDYTQTSLGILNIGVTDDTTYGKLVVAGTATLPSNAKINVDVTDPNFAFTTAYDNGMAEVISAGTLTSDGTFSVTDNSLLFNFDAVKNGNNVALTLSSAAPAVLTSTTNEGLIAGAGAASVIDEAITDNPTGEFALSFVSLTTEQEVADAVESTLPGVSGGVSQVTNIATNAVTGVVSARQDLTRGLSSGDGFMTDRHIWFKPFGGWTEQDDRQNVTGYDIDSYGLAAGFDGDVSSTWNVGVALAYINSDVESNLTSGSHSIDMDSYMAKVYATKMFDDVTALNIQVGAGISDYDSQRRIFTGDVANADYDSWNVQLSAELERSYQVSDKTVLTPYVHADYGYVNVEDYSEAGAGALNLNVGDDSADSLIIGAGVKANHSVSDSLLLMANAGVGYDVMTDHSSLTSSFAGGGAQFTTEGIEPDEWVYNAGVGAKYNLDNGTEITADYNIDARQDYTDQSVSVNFRLMF